MITERPSLLDDDLHAPEHFLGAIDSRIAHPQLLLLELVVRGDGGVVEQGLVRVLVQDYGQLVPEPNAEEVQSRRVQRAHRDVLYLTGRFVLHQEDVLVGMGLLLQTQVFLQD